MFPARGGVQRVKVDNEIGEVAASIVEEHSEFALQQINNELRLQLPHKPLICLSSLRKALDVSLSRCRGSCLLNGCCRMNKKLSLSMNQDFIFGYPGAVNGQGKDNVHYGPREGPHFACFWRYQINVLFTT